MLDKLAVLSIISAALLFISGAIDKIYMLPIAFAVAYITFFLIWAVSCFICTRFVNMKKKYKADSRLFRGYTNCIVDSLAQLMRIKLHVSGTELLPKEKFLLAGNHKSAMDPLLTMGVLRRYHMGFIAKKSIFKIPIICRLMHRCFCLSLDRDNIRQQAKAIDRAAEIIMSQEASIGVYPEGTRNRGSELMPFMNGAFKIAKKAECPIVVAVIKNPEFISKNAPFKRTDVYLDFIGVLDKDFVSQHTTTQIGNTVFDMINNEMQKTK